MIFVGRYWGNRRTMEELDRRIGQRRDATRAPNQARSGWRPSGRLLGKPATPSKNGGETAGSTGDPFALRANGNMGPSKSRIVNHRFGSQRTERLINLALGPNRTSQSVHQLVSYNLRTLDGRGRDLRISI